MRAGKLDTECWTEIGRALYSADLDRVSLGVLPLHGPALLR